MMDRWTDGIAGGGASGYPGGPQSQWKRGAWRA